jgi:hypothetical protein
MVHFTAQRKTVWKIWKGDQQNGWNKIYQNKSEYTLTDL